LPRPVSLFRFALCGVLASRVFASLRGPSSVGQWPHFLPFLLFPQSHRSKRRREPMKNPNPIRTSPSSALLLCCSSFPPTHCQLHLAGRRRPLRPPCLLRCPRASSCIDFFSRSMDMLPSHGAENPRSSRRLQVFPVDAGGAGKRGGATSLLAGAQWRRI
jgi:hypothetical protein